MREENKKVRHDAITAAAYSLLAVKGYDGTSMLRIAKAAKASNETLYRWYGDKRGLFEAMVRDNAADVEERLKSAIAHRDEPMEILARLAPIFLTMLLGDKAILLNRAAAADPTGELGAAISAGGRDVVQPLFVNLMKGVAKGNEGEARKLTGMFLGLLIGDLQIKRVIGVCPSPTKDEIEDRVAAAFDAFAKLLTYD